MQYLPAGRHGGIRDLYLSEIGKFSQIKLVELLELSPIGSMNKKELEQTLAKP